MQPSAQTKPTAVTHQMKPGSTHLPLTKTMPTITEPQVGGQHGSRFYVATDGRKPGGDNPFLKSILDEVRFNYVTW